MSNLGGFIPLWRQMLDWEWIDDPAVVSVWIQCLLRAAFKDGSWRGMQIKRGQLFTSSKSLASHCGLSRQQVRGALAKLEKTQNLTIDSTNLGMLITVCKYESYNGLNFESNQQPNQRATNEQPTFNQPPTNEQPHRNKENNENNENNETNTDVDPDFFAGDNKPKPDKRKGTEEQLRAYATEIGLLKSDGSYLCDKWQGNGWTNDGKPIKDGRATMRSWKRLGILPSQRATEQQNDRHKRGII
jgi:hypothetical protein